MKACRIAGLIVVLVLAAVISSNGQQGVEVPNLINYQGRLLNGTNLYNGIVPITFRLYTVPSGPDMPVCVDSNNVEVVDGFYSTYIGDNVTWGSLDNALNNTQVWVEVVIGTNVMAPRELMASVAYARYAARMPANSVDLSMIRENAIQFWHIANGAVRGNHIQAGTISNVNLAAGSVTSNKIDWSTMPAPSGLKGYAESGDFAAAPMASGNDAIALGYRTVASADYASVGGGKDSSAKGEAATVAGGDNNVANGAYASVGGGQDNQADADYATVGGGEMNEARSTCSTVAGGSYNWASGPYSAIGGGEDNTSSGDSSTISGGSQNTAIGQSSTVSGGQSNLASNNFATVGGGRYNRANAVNAVVGGGATNTAGGEFSTIGGGRDNYIEFIARGASIAGGESNTVKNIYAAIVGGRFNTADGLYTFVGGGEGNDAQGAGSIVVGGAHNQALGFGAFVGGGERNSGNALVSVVIGGAWNAAEEGADFAAIGGGGGNTMTANATNSVIGGGWTNRISGSYSVIGGGQRNEVSGTNAVVAGGYSNLASGISAAVPGGSQNQAGGNYSLAAGRRAKARHNGTFVWADSTDRDFGSSKSNQFLIRASGGVGIGTTNPLQRLHVNGAVHIASSTHHLTYPLDEPFLIGQWDGYGFYEQMRFLPNGSVGIGTASPIQRLHVAGGIHIAGASYSLTFRTNDTFRIGHYTGATFTERMCITTAGRVGIGTNNPHSTSLLHVEGNVRAQTLSLTSGADLAEPFPMADIEQIPAGAVVIIDENKPGHLCISREPYDRKVAGVVSGANGIRPGIVLSQEERLDTGRSVALSGRVYVLADASEHPIRPGDLLTTSARPGHARAVTDYPRAQGATIGKAMTSLEQGQGLVLVLVSLQ